MYGILTMKFEEIYPKYDGFINICLKKVCDLQDLKDIKQEILIKIFKRCESIKNPVAIKSWISRLVCNHLVDYFRGRRLNFINFSGIAIDPEIQEYFEPENMLVEEKDPSVICENKELKSKIQEILNKMGDPWKNMIIARELNNLRYEEIAKKYAIKLGTVKSRIARARQRFIKKFHEKE